MANLKIERGLFKGHFNGPLSGWKVPTIVGIFILAIMLNLAVLSLSIWALVFGIIDIATVGANFWAVVWIILGVIGLSSFFGGNK